MKTIIYALGFLTAISGHGELVFNFVKIADTSTAVPGGTGNFATFIVPANDGTNVAFRGSGSAGQLGVYESTNGALTRLANQSTPVPGGAAGAFSDMEYPSARGTDVVFFASATSGSVLTQEGIYRANINSNSLQVIADKSTAIPSGSGNFVFFDVTVSASGRGVFFTGRGASSTQSGAFLHDGVSLIRVADRNTPPIPSGTGNFIGWFGPSLEGTNLAFRGLGNSSQEGIYLGNTNSLARVADKTTAVPSGIGLFTGFGVPSVFGTNVAFQGFGTNGQVGIYFGTTNSLTRIAGTNTPIPGGGGKFSGFGSSALGYPTSFDGQNVAFLGQGAVSGIFLYTGADAALHRVVVNNMSLGGKQVSLLNIQQEALSGNSIAFWVGFSDGTVGIWKATFLTPSPPALSIERAPPDSVRLLWPTNDPAFGLQFNTNLNTTNWASASPLPVVLGTNNVVTNAASGTQKLYRLFKP